MVPSRPDHSISIINIIIMRAKQSAAHSMHGWTLFFFSFSLALKIYTWHTPKCHINMTLKRRHITSYARIRGIRAILLWSFNYNGLRRAKWTRYDWIIHQRLEKIRTEALKPNDQPYPRIRCDPDVSPLLSVCVALRWIPVFRCIQKAQRGYRGHPDAPVVLQGWR